MELAVEFVTLEEAILAMLDPETVGQAEVMLEALFTNPSSVTLIHPLLISPNPRMRHHTLTFLPRILTLYQRTSSTFPPELSQFIWQAFMLSDDPQSLSYTWILISPILRLINPDSFLESLIANF
jgi:hypothetical protein